MSTPIIWIPIADCEPALESRILFYSQGHIGIGTFRGFGEDTGYKVDYTLYGEAIATFIEVTYWAPLPQSPKFYEKYGVID